MVWTAGHCVGAQGGESYYSNWEFCPEYSNGPNPTVGCWTWSQAQLTGGWYYDGHRYDVTNPNGTAGADPGQEDDSIGSSQTPGFSGGSWIIGFGVNSANDPIGHTNYINGNNSYYFTSGGPGGGNEEGIEIQSPYYETDACFWQGGSKWSGTC